MMTNVKKISVIYFFDLEKENYGRIYLDVQTLVGHNQTVTCLIHPHSEYSRYDIQHLLSGSIDHSIRLWDLSTNTQLHMFTVHSGTILMFHIPPPMLNVTKTLSFKNKSIFIIG
jgi:WD40 repeat protein